MRDSCTAQYERSRSDSATAVTLWVQVKVGNYYLVRLGSSVYDPNWNTLVWRTACNLPNPALTQPTMINFSLQAGGFQTFEFISEPIPTQGNIEYSFNLRPAATSGILSDQNFVTVSSVVGDIVDADGQIIRQIETETGDENGELYEYTEQYGDGPVVIAPGAMSPVNDFTVPVPGWVYKNEPAQPLDELEAKYIHDQVTKGADLITGTVDAFDSIDLVDGMRVNYLQVSMRGGSASIEVYEIQDHDLEAVPRRFREEVTGNPNPGSGWNWNRWIERRLSIGELAEDIDREGRTTLLCELDNPSRRGLTYWVINSDEMSEEDRWAGIYPFVPVMTDSNGNVVPEPEEGEDVPEGTITRYGPGVIKVPIESGFFSAPAGSMIVKAPGQDETESGETDEDIEDIFIDVEAIDKRVKEGEDALDHLENVQMPLLEQQLLELEDELADLNNIILPELEDKIDNLNDVQLPALQSQITALDDSIDDLNDVVIPNLNSELNTLDGYFNDPSSIPSNYDFFTGIVANNGFINSLVTRDLFTDNLAAKNAFVNQIVANNAFIDSLTSRDLFTDNLVANNGFINELVANNTFTNNLAAKNAFVNRIVANDAFINTLTSRDLFTDNLTAKTAWVNDMTAAIINVGDLYSRNATIRGHLTVGTSSVAGQISVVGAGTIVVDSNGRIRLNSNGSLEVGNNGNVRINSGGTISIGSGGTISIGSGGTISIGSGSTFTMGTGAQMNIGNRIFIGQNLSSFEADNRVFIGNWSNSESAGNIRPIVQVRQNDDNYVLMFARPYESGDLFFTVRSNGQDVLTAFTGEQNIAGTLEVSQKWYNTK